MKKRGKHACEATSASRHVKKATKRSDREQDTDGGKDTHAYVPTSKESRAKEHKADDSEKPRTHVVCFFEDE